MKHADKIYSQAAVLARDWLWAELVSQIPFGDRLQSQLDGTAPTRAKAVLTANPPGELQGFLTEYVTDLRERLAHTDLVELLQTRPHKLSMRQGSGATVANVARKIITIRLTALDQMARIYQTCQTPPNHD